MTKKLWGICFVMRHFMPDIQYRIRWEKSVHVFCKASVLGSCLIACSWLPTNKRKQSGSLLCNVYYIGGSGLRFKQKWVTTNRKWRFWRLSSSKNCTKTPTQETTNKFIAGGELRNSMAGEYLIPGLEVEHSSFYWNRMQGECSSTACG